jgi:drug/metabolite transporter (DMT)-like permease
MSGEFFTRYTGEIAGVTTSVLWTATALLFTAATRRLGPTLLNTVRICFAIVLLGLTHYGFTGHWIPQAVAGQVMFLALSGIVGLAIGDQALFTAFMDIGPRLAMLIMTTAPLMAAMFGWIVLGETLGLIACTGILLTIGGVAWVVLERPSTPAAATLEPRIRLRGLILALIAALCQAGGMLLSKQGIGHGWLPKEDHLPPQTATLIRMFFAGVGMIPIIWIHRRRERRRRARGINTPPALSRRIGFMFAFCGAITGPFLGVWMMLIATDRSPIGVAQTLCSLTPIFILPAVILLHGERISPRAVLGAVVAVAGSALLFVRVS